MRFPGPAKNVQMIWLANRINGLCFATSVRYQQLRPATAIYVSKEPTPTEAFRISYFLRDALRRLFIVFHTMWAHALSTNHLERI